MESLAGWLRLRHAPGLGPAKIRSLLTHFISPATLLEADTRRLQQHGLETHTINFLKSDTLPPAIEAELRWAEHPTHTIMGFTDKCYPEYLKLIDQPPIVLYIKGDPGILHDPQLAMVGSRSPTPAGAQIAFEFSRHLAATGLVITSGLALGIDAASHKGALAANGITIAVMGTGLDLIYPAIHAALADEILQNKGALVSEFPLGTRPRPERFPQRNRIISGLTLGTLVIEAAHQSGSLITARHALEQSREVFAIPGSIHSPLSKGCHQLIRQGAKLVESVQDILEELAPSIRESLKKIPVTAAANTDASTDAGTENPGSNLDPEYNQLLTCLGYNPASIDELITRSGLSADIISSMLLILELKGIIAPGADGRYSQLPPPL